MEDKATYPNFFFQNELVSPTSDQDQPSSGKGKDKIRRELKCTYTCTLRLEPRGIEFVDDSYLAVEKLLNTNSLPGGSST